MRTTTTLLAFAALACGAERSPAAADDGPAAGARPAAGACAVHDDLPPLAADAATCPAVAPLGAPASLSFVRHHTAPCAERVAVDGGGSAAFQAVEQLGGGGYWRGVVDAFRPDGTAAAPDVADSRLLVPGAAGFLSYSAPSTVRWTGSRWDGWSEAAIPWPVVLPEAMFWPSWYAGVLGVAPGHGGELLVALAGADARGDAELDVARIAPGPTLPHAPARVATFPAPDPRWTEDRHAAALRRAAGAVALGADGDGRVLVLWDGAGACGPGTLAGRWLGADGAALGPVFLAARGEDTPDPTEVRRDPRLFRLPDGSLVLRRDDGTFARRFAGGLPAGGPPPAWLADRTGEELAPLPLAGVVAAVRPPDARGAARVDVVTAAGQVCARLAPPAQSMDETTRVYAGTPAPAVGLDGTVVALDRVEPPAGEAGARCRYRVWRGAIR